MNLGIRILHEYGAPRHFQALCHMAQETHVPVESGEFDLHKQVGRLVLGRPHASLDRLAHNLKFLVRVSRASNQLLVVGAAPYDPIIVWLRRLKARNQVIYFTSWPFWEGGRCPKRPLLPAQRDLWYDFLDGLEAVAVTAQAKEALAARGAQVVHIPHSVDTALFHPGPAAARAQGPTAVLFVGQLIERKGMRQLINVIRDRAWEDVQFWFVGRGPYSARITELAREMRVRYLGYVSDRHQLARIYRRSDILVLPSVESHRAVEPFGLTLLEAMASGLPVVATDCVGPREIVDDGVDGYIVPQDDVPALGEALRVLARDRAKRQRFGMAARRKAEGVYSMPRVAEQWHAFLETAQCRRGS